MRSNARNPREVWTGRYRGATFVASPCHRINRWLSLAPSGTYALVPYAPRFHRRRDVARAIFAGTLIAFRPIERGCLGARL
jgi:hypothetical protein